MDIELIFIGLFSLFGCVFFVLFLTCFQRALQLGRGGRHIDHGDEELAQGGFIPSSGDVDDDLLLTGSAVHNPLATLSKSTLAACQYSNNLHFMKRLSRSLTAERSALIMPCILREFSVPEVESATAKFSSSNIIKHGHSGDIFKGVLEGGEVVVIKKVNCMKKKTRNNYVSKGGYNLDNMVINKDYYAAEMDVYGKVLDQSFLVPMLGQCLGVSVQEEKFLVYEYMTYGDLASILAEARAANNAAEKQAQLKYIEESAEEEDDGITTSSSTTTNTTDTNTAIRRTNTTPNYVTTVYDVAAGVGAAKCRVLSWPMRLRIAREVAEALVYLHHESRPPLSHRNVQGSSVLINKDFEVKLGSLGDAQKIESGELPMYDIYCFGRLLLDLISGLDISGNARDEGVQAWISKCFHALTTSPPLARETQYINNNNILLSAELIDKNLVGLVQEHHLVEMVQVAQLAKLCMEPTTLQKLSMKGVLQMLPPPTKRP